MSHERVGYGGIEKSGCVLQYLQIIVINSNKISTVIIMLIDVMVVIMIRDTNYDENDI